MSTKLAAAALVLTGCATIFAGNTAAIQIRSNPGAPIMVDGAPAGQSPGVVLVSANQPHQIVVGDHACTLLPQIGVLWVVLDVVLGLVPVVVDAITGAWVTVNGDQCYI
jgi:hypothetical protein